MLSNTLNTNEVKDAAGTEVEFQTLSIGTREHLFGQITETPAYPHRIRVRHSETGAGLKLRRRSNIRVDLTSISEVDNVTPVTDSVSITVDFAVGAHNVSTKMAKVLAELGSFTFLDGTGNTFLYDGSGNGAKALLTGGI